MQCTFPCFLNLKIRKERNYEAYQGEADSSLAVLGKKKLTHIFVTVGLKELKVARYSFSGSIPPKFEHKLRCHKQSFRKIATTVVLDEDENLFLSGLQRHRSCHSNEMTLLPILLVAVYLGTGNYSSKIIHGSFFLQ